MSNQAFNITPEPQVLIALTNTPLKPIDAICELVDNSLDAFIAARMQKKAVSKPWIQINIPGAAEVGRGEGKIRIADNGIGLDQLGLRNALTAGLSSKNQYDTLGLFGMGFNIATGKLGTKTVITTCRAEDDFAIRTVLDLPKLVEDKSFELQYEQIPKPSDFTSGTIVEISGWWPAGNSNSDFIKKLAGIPKKEINYLLGRRYASILRREDESSVQFFLNDEVVRGFEHCVWAPNRFVERKDWGRISALQEFDQVLSAQRHCVKDRVVVDNDATSCPQCGGVQFQIVSERVRGWVGIQRFDDADNYGVDLIRNGRAIRVGEKEAVFFFEDELGRKTKEYPVDQIYGRIVGEVHLDHVMVDYTKQDFARASESWSKAMEFLRGESLLEGSWAPGYKNESPIGKLFKGFRKVRTPGRTDMYMGKYDEAKRQAVRISREVEREYFERFLNHEPGYYDDANWWKHIEDASTPILKGLVSCPSCDFQISDAEEVCPECSHILKAKSCVQCSADIPASSLMCEICGVSQVPEITSPWKCQVCLTTNSQEDEICSLCNCLAGTPNPCSLEVLNKVSKALAEFSFENRVFELDRALSSKPVSLEAFEVPPGHLVPIAGDNPVPLISDIQVGRLKIFIDTSHRTLAAEPFRIKFALTSEVVNYLVTLNPELIGRTGFSNASLTSKLMEDLWPIDDADEFSLTSSIHALFGRISELLINSPEVAEFYLELSQEEQASMTNKIISKGELDRLPEYSKTGGYLAFVPLTAIARLHSRYPKLWGERVLLVNQFGLAGEIGDDAMNVVLNRLHKVFHQALEICADFATLPSAAEEDIRLTTAAIEYINAKVQ